MGFDPLSVIDSPLQVYNCGENAANHTPLSIKSHFFSDYDNHASYPPQNRVTNNYGTKLILGGL